MTLVPVQCTVEFSDDQGAAWRVRDLELVEELDRPYFCTASIVTDESDVDVGALVGVRASFVLERDEAGRRFTGLVFEAEYLGTFDGRVHARIRVEPTLCLLRQQNAHRIFQEQTSVDVVSEVLGEAFAAFGATLDDSQIDSPPPIRDYCVQFGETDFEFVSRVLAEDGISYAFDHGAEGAGERMVLFDANACFCAVGEPLSSSAPSEPRILALVPTETEEHPRESISFLGWSRSSAPMRRRVRQWDWKQPKPTLLEGSSTDEARADRYGELVEFHPRRVAEADHGNGPHVDEGSAIAARGLAQSRRRGQRHRGRSNAVALAPGGLLAVEDHPHPEADHVPLVATRVTARLDVPAAESHGGGLAAFYENEFDALPVATLYRPEAPKAPKIAGPQTAIVVGPPGEDIHTDAHGRVRVRFHWDEREGERAQSAWVRVVQAWGGAGFGSGFIPRVGSEVVVSFLDGHPDRPIVTGCVYNAEAAPPVSLPQSRTQTALYSRSTPGGEGYSGLCIDDAAGAEKFSLRAQKDLCTSVLGDETWTVCGDASLYVSGDWNREIDGRVLTAIGKDRQTVVGDQDQTTIRGSRTLQVLCEDGGKRTDVVQGEYDIVVRDKLTISVGGGGSKLVMTPTSIELFAAERIVLGTSSNDTSIALSRQEIVVNRRDGGFAQFASGGVDLEGDEISVSGYRGVTVRQASTGSVGASLTVDADKAALTATTVEASCAADPGAKISVCPGSARCEAAQVTLEATACLDASGGGGTVKLAAGQALLN